MNPQRRLLRRLRIFKSPLRLLQMSVNRVYLLLQLSPVPKKRPKRIGGPFGQPRRLCERSAQHICSSMVRLIRIWPGTVPSSRRCFSEFRIFREAVLSIRSFSRWKVSAFSESVWKPMDLYRLRSTRAPMANSNSLRRQPHLLRKVLPLRSFVTLNLLVQAQRSNVLRRSMSSMRDLTSCHRQCKRCLPMPSGRTTTRASCAECSVSLQRALKACL